MHKLFGTRKRKTAAATSSAGEEKAILEMDSADSKSINSNSNISFSSDRASTSGGMLGGNGNYVGVVNADNYSFPNSKSVTEGRENFVLKSSNILVVRQLQQHHETVSQACAVFIETLNFNSGPLGDNELARELYDQVVSYAKSNSNWILRSEIIPSEGIEILAATSSKLEAAFILLERIVIDQSNGEKWWERANSKGLHRPSIALLRSEFDQETKKGKDQLDLEAVNAQVDKLGLVLEQKFSGPSLLAGPSNSDSSAFFGMVNSGPQSAGPSNTHPPANTSATAADPGLGPSPSTSSLSTPPTFTTPLSVIEPASPPNQGLENLASLKTPDSPPKPIFATVAIKPYSRGSFSRSSISSQGSRRKSDSIWDLSADKEKMEMEKAKDKEKEKEKEKEEEKEEEKEKGKNQDQETKLNTATVLPVTTVVPQRVSSILSPADVNITDSDSTLIAKKTPTTPKSDIIVPLRTSSVALSEADAEILAKLDVVVGVGKCRRPSQGSFVEGTEGEVIEVDPIFVTAPRSELVPEGEISGLTRTVAIKKYDAMGVVMPLNTADGEEKAVVMPLNTADGGEKAYGMDDEEALKRWNEIKRDSSCNPITPPGSNENASIVMMDRDVAVDESVIAVSLENYVDVNEGEISAVNIIPQPLDHKKGKKRIYYNSPPSEWKNLETLLATTLETMTAIEANHSILSANAKTHLTSTAVKPNETAGKTYLASLQTIHDISQFLHKNYIPALQAYQASPIKTKCLNTLAQLDSKRHVLAIKMKREQRVFDPMNSDYVGSVGDDAALLCCRDIVKETRNVVGALIGVQLTIKEE